MFTVFDWGFMFLEAMPVGTVFKERVDAVCKILSKYVLTA